MKSVYLLRHAKSSWDDPAADDFDRPLNERGEKAAHGMAAYMARAGLRPAVVLCSPAARARRTAAIVLEALGDAPVIRFDKRLYLADWDTLLGCIQALEDEFHSALLVGHNPGLEALARMLADRRRGNRAALKRLVAKYPTGALAVFNSNIGAWRNLDAGKATLEAFVRPRFIGEDAAAPPPGGRPE